MSDAKQDIIRVKSKPLENIRIAITCVDLEQAEHRGIAYLSKSIIRSLSEQGAEVYLLTGFYGKRLSFLMKLMMNKFSVNEVDIADILDQLNDPKSSNPKKLKKTDQEINYLEKIIQKLISYKNRFRKMFFLIRTILEFYLKGCSFSGKLIELKDIENSPYWGEERIDYLKYINGFISIPNIFLFSTLRSKRILMKSPTIDIRKNNIDFLITTCPLSINVKMKGNIPSNILQIIMDFIPLSFSKHPDHPYGFYNRLQDSMDGKCCFISENSRNKICQLLNKKAQKYNNNILYPIPSLNLDSLTLANNLNNVRDINSNFILFNSSVVPRKNLHFLIQAFQSSNISNHGFQLCVAGKIHDDQYGERIKDLCEKDSSIRLLGYVDEIEKTWLFLNAHAFISPSCVEGFGIPVLDAYILGLNVLASNIPAHQEIGNISAVDRKLNLLDLNNFDSWISALRQINSEQKITSILKRQRISNFKKSFQDLNKKFDEKLVELICKN
tara:strand:+ start:523 stop:2016 length:1494 start_codon:yes stop_codon:yes gene_type:complete